MFLGASQLQNQAADVARLIWEYEDAAVARVRTDNSKGGQSLGFECRICLSLQNGKSNMTSHLLSAHQFGNPELVNQLKAFIAPYYQMQATNIYHCKLCRKVLTEIVRGDHDKVEVTVDNLEHYLGVPRHKHGLAEEKDQVGQVTGLAWTEVGGELLTIESAIVEGKGKFVQTGQLGDVMKESIQAAMTVVRSRANVLGIRPDFNEAKDVHIHVPEGATPKDGPSAGVGMCTALVSALTGIPVRAEVAMTGEITLRGEVLPIGGLKEKLLAAHRGGIPTVLIPDENEKDLAEIPENIKAKLKIIPVRWVDQVLEVALIHQPAPLPESQEQSPSDTTENKVEEKATTEVRAH